MTLQLAAYLNLVLASLCETVMTATILAHMLFGNASTRLPGRPRFILKASQIGFTATGVFCLLSAESSWPAYYALIIATLLWFQFWSQVGVMDFHAGTKKWSNPDADTDNSTKDVQA